jgi:hypothetical protein
MVGTSVREVISSRRTNPRGVMEFPEKSENEWNAWPYVRKKIWSAIQHSGFDVLDEVPPRYDGDGVFVVSEDEVRVDVPPELHPSRSAFIYFPRQIADSIHYRIEEAGAELLGGEVDRSEWHDIRTTHGFAEVKSCERIDDDGSVGEFVIYEYEINALLSHGEDVILAVYERDTDGVGTVWEWAVHRMPASDVPVGWGFDTDFDWEPSKHDRYEWEARVPWPEVIRPEDCPSEEWYSEVVDE